MKTKQTPANQPATCKPSTEKSLAKSHQRFLAESYQRRNQQLELCTQGFADWMISYGALLPLVCETIDDVCYILWEALAKVREGSLRIPFAEAILIGMRPNGEYLTGLARAHVKDSEAEPSEILCMIAYALWPVRDVILKTNAMKLAKETRPADYLRALELLAICETFLADQGNADIGKVGDIRKPTATQKLLNEARGAFLKKQIEAVRMKRVDAYLQRAKLIAKSRAGQGATIEPPLIPFARA